MFPIGKNDVQRLEGTSKSCIVSAKTYKSWKGLIASNKNTIGTVFQI